MGPNYLTFLVPNLKLLNPPRKSKMMSKKQRSLFESATQSTWQPDTEMEIGKNYDVFQYFNLLLTAKKKGSILTT